MRSPGLLLSLALALLGACTPGTTDIDPGTGGMSGTGGMNGTDDLPTCKSGNSMADIEKNVFQSMKCSSCHSKMTLFPTTMDTVSPGLAERVVGKKAESDPLKGKCADRDLLPKDDPTSGLFYEKVAGKPACGDRMPQALAPLTPDEITCVKRWVLMAAKEAP